MHELRPSGVSLREDPDRLWTYAELAEWIGVPERSVRKWVSDGNGPAVLRLGRHVRIRVGDALEWIAAKRETAA